jgi:hypothetical protein
MTFRTQQKFEIEKKSNDSEIFTGVECFLGSGVTQLVKKYPIEQMKVRMHRD